MYGDGDTRVFRHYSWMIAGRHMYRSVLETLTIIDRRHYRLDPLHHLRRLEKLYAAAVFDQVSHLALSIASARAGYHPAARSEVGSSIRSDRFGAGVLMSRLITPLA